MSALADALEARREEVMGWITREIGGTQAKAALEVRLVLGVLREAAVLPFMVEGRILPEDIPGKESRSYRQPVGVIALISPWNFPLQLTARTLAPALAVGNGVVLKPASDSIVTGGTIFAKLLEEAGFPEGLVSVLPGGGSDIGTALIEHEVPRLVSFTGSTPVGRGIAETVAKSAILKPLELELGGNGPIVWMTQISRRLSTPLSGASSCMPDRSAWRSIASSSTTASLMSSRTNSWNAPGL